MEEETEGVLLGKKIEGFPYPIRYCFYCERELILERVAHLPSVYEYKAVFFCLNKECGAYDEASRKAYALVYYSSPEAEEALYQYRIWMPPHKKT